MGSEPNVPPVIHCYGRDARGSPPLDTHLGTHTSQPPLQLGVGFWLVLAHGTWGEVTSATFRFIKITWLLFSPFGHIDWSGMETSPRKALHSTVGNGEAFFSLYSWTTAWKRDAHEPVHLPSSAIRSRSQLCFFLLFFGPHLQHT